MKKPKHELQDYGAADILSMDIQQPKWAVPEILPEGLNILAGKPKRGKSIMALNMAISISCGVPVLGKFNSVKGPVIYLALEDTLRRLQTRLKTMLAAGGKASNDLRCYTDFPRMHEGGTEYLEERIKFNSGVRLIIIDTLPKFRPPKDRNISEYEFDYQNGVALKDLADRCNVSILVIHHMRKTKAEDRFDEVIGSFGVTGSADGIMLLIRPSGQANAELHITGRDVEETEFSMELDYDFLCWNIIGDTKVTSKSNKQQIIMSCLKNSLFSMSPKEVSEATELDHAYVKTNLIRLWNQGFIQKTEFGKYENIDI
jgi:RecA-family ATPase